MKNMKTSNYDKFPIKAIKNGENEAVSGWSSIAHKLKDSISSRLAKNEKCVVVIDCYPCTDTDELYKGISSIKVDKAFFSDSCALTAETLDEKLAADMTDDRVFGVMTTKKLSYCFDEDLIQSAKSELNSIKSGVILVYGVGASLITEGDILVYADLARWEIQLRWRNGLSNWRSNNSDAPILSKYKRGFFAEWRFADKHKKALFQSLDFLIDTNRKDNPAMVTGDGFRRAMLQISHEPFRTVPYFDPGVWGGQWMKDVCGLDKSKENFAWSFDGVPEENSLLLKFGDVSVEVPAMDLILSHPRELLGERVHARFGAEFPIRFDFLDTIGGQNLSLQVHPLTEYIQENFNMHYTQDESYYILDVDDSSDECEQDSPCVYLGVKNNVNQAEMIDELKKAERGEKLFPADDYINRFPVKKHDHVLIPAGTIHCSGRNTMVLEISATPYIFTFKLWDWGRLGLDGLPRPTHIEHGEKNIQWDRDTDWVKKNLLHREKVLLKKDGIIVERTGMHEREFIDTFRYTFTKPVVIYSNDSVNVLNLVEGSEAVITSPTDAFEPFTVHYAETFIIPASVGSYVVSPVNSNEELMLLQATVQDVSQKPYRDEQ